MAAAILSPGNGTKKLNTAETQWARLFRNVQEAGEYLERRQTEIQDDGTKNAATARANWSKMLSNAIAKARENGKNRTNRTTKKEG